MTNFIIYFIPVSYILVFCVTFPGRSLYLLKRTGKNPEMFPTDGSAQDYVGKCFKKILFLLFLYSISLKLIIPCSIGYFTIVDFTALKYLGVILKIFSFIWTFVAQINMNDSWRIGIDKNSKTSLITTGLFRMSRNPVFLGMLMMLIGLFLMVPSFISLFFLMITYIIIQIQIRLEEDFLFNRHGQSYMSYKNKVRRFI